MAPNIPSRVIGMDINAGGSFVSIGMESGAKIFSVDPMHEKTHIAAETIGSVRKVQMLNASNFIAFLSGGKHPKFPDNVALLWDDSEKAFFAKIAINEPIKNIKMTRSHIILLSENRVYVFNMANGRIIKSYELPTDNNHMGLCEVHEGGKKEFCIFPSQRSSYRNQGQAGSLSILNLVNLSQNVLPKQLNAHKSPVVCLSLDLSGNKLVTASNTGTLIRVWSLVTDSHQMLYEFRRGIDSAHIYCLAFSPGSEFVLVGSNKGTIHIWSLKEKNKVQMSSNVIEKELNKFNSGQTFSLPDQQSYICVFLDNQSFAVFSKDGSFHKVSFAPEFSNAPKRIQYDKYLQKHDEI